MTKTFKKWKSFVNEAQQDKKFVKKFNISVLQKNTAMQPGTNPREYHQQIAQQAELGPIFPNTVLAEIEALDDRYFPRENRKIYTKWLANVLLGMLTKHYSDTEIPEGKTLRDIHPSWTGYIRYIQGGDGLLYIVDFLNGARDIPQGLWDSDWSTMRAAAEDWHEELSHIVDTGEYKTKNVVWDFGNGYTIVDIPSEDLEIEGNKMGHCVGGYCRFVDEGNKIYSLRDANNEPHVTISYQTNSRDRPGGELYEIKGKQNKPPIKKYGQMVSGWLKENFPKEEYIDTEDYYSLLGDEELEGLIEEEGFIKNLKNNLYRFRGAGQNFWTKVVQKIADIKRELDEESTHVSKRSGAYASDNFLEFNGLKEVISKIFYDSMNNELEGGLNALDPIIETISEERLQVTDMMLLDTLSPPARTLWPSNSRSHAKRYRGAGPYDDRPEEEQIELIKFYEKIYNKTKIQDRFNDKNFKSEELIGDRYEQGQISTHRALVMATLANSDYTSPETVNDIWESLTVNGGLDPFNDFLDSQATDQKKWEKKLKGAKILRELLMNKNLSEKNIVGVLKNFIDPETGTLIYEPATKVIPTDLESRSGYSTRRTASRPIKAFSFERLGHEAQDSPEKKAEVAYGLLSRNKALSPKLVELLAKTAIQKDIENNKIIEDNPQAVGNYESTWKVTSTLEPSERGKRYGGLEFAHEEYTKGGAQWKEPLMANPSMSEEVFYQLIENAPPAFTKLLMGNRGAYKGVNPWGGVSTGKSSDKYYRKVVYRALKDFVVTTNKMVQALEKDEVNEPRGLTLDPKKDYGVTSEVPYGPENHKKVRGQVERAQNALFKSKSDLGGLAQFYYRQAKDSFVVIANIPNNMSKAEREKLAKSLKKLSQERKNWISPVTKDFSIYWLVDARGKLSREANRIRVRTGYYDYLFDEEGNAKPEEDIDVSEFNRRYAENPEMAEERRQKEARDSDQERQQEREWVRQEMSGVTK